MMNTKNSKGYLAHGAAAGFAMLFLHGCAGPVATQEEATASSK